MPNTVDIEVTPWYVRAHHDHYFTEVMDDDNSIQIHSCHSLTRQLEVLHDKLLDLFAADKSLKPQDVVVMLPDVASAMDNDRAALSPCLLYTSPSPRDGLLSRMPSSA